MSTLADDVRWMVEDLREMRFPLRVLSLLFVIVGSLTFLVSIVVIVVMVLAHAWKHAPILYPIGGVLVWLSVAIARWLNDDGEAGR